jgi:hypothetical protein
MKLENDNLRLVGKTAYHDYINGVTVGKEAWIHTRNNSYDQVNGTQIKNQDLTDVVSGDEENTWYSSRRKAF